VEVGTGFILVALLIFFETARQRVALSLLVTPMPLTINWFRLRKAARSVVRSRGGKPLEVYLDATDQFRALLRDLVDSEFTGEDKDVGGDGARAGMPLPGFKRVTVAQTWFMPPSTASSIPEM
jgi:hypothetical protein